MRYLGMICFCVLFLCSCDARPLFAQETIRIKDHEFIVALAATPEQHAYGLMHQKSIADNEGMLFLFDEERIRRFWMKDTPVDLEIAFIDGSYFIVDIQTMSANTLSVHSSRYPAKYALEVKQGIFGDKNIQVGDAVEFLFEENILAR